jgi:hypothetical protein
MSSMKFNEVLTLQTKMMIELQQRFSVPSNCNSNNHREYRPYIIVNNTTTMVIGNDWYWKQLVTQTRNHIELILKHFQIEKQLVDSVTVPHDVDVEKHKDIYVQIYKAYLNQFDYHMWYPSVKDIMTNGAVVLELSGSDVIQLEKKAELHHTTDESYTMTVDDQKDFSTEFIQQVKQFVNKCDDGVFVRLTNTSSKNEQILKPLDSTSDVLNFLIRSRTFYSTYNIVLHPVYAFPREVYAIMMPWNNKLDLNNEYRVFIYKNKVVAISQQQWFSSKYFSEYHCNQVAQSIQSYYNDKLKARLPYPSVVLDVWVDSNYQTHLIECNPWGCYNASGSSLFHWIKDYEILHQEQDDVTTYMRYITPS